MIRKWTLIALLVWSHVITGQDKESTDLADQLRNIQTDSGKVSLLKQLSTELLQTNYDSAMSCARQALSISQQSKDPELISGSLQNLGEIETYQDATLETGITHLQFIHS